MRWNIVSSEVGRYAHAAALTQFLYVRQGLMLRGEPPERHNYSFTITDDWETVRRNRQGACALFGYEADNCVVPAQVHGAGVAIVGTEQGGAGVFTPETAIPGCDALVTATPGILLCITIADCLPIFLLDPIRRIIGLAHSGWRGTAGRIAPRALEAMTAHFGTRSEDCLIAIGPGIGPEGYEVDEKVYTAFETADAAAPGVFAPTRPGHWALDLTAAVHYQLRTCGVPESHNFIAPWRTNRDTDLLFSHRLAPGCPRMAAFLGMTA